MVTAGLRRKRITKEDVLEDTLDFFILNTISDKSLHDADIDRRIERVRRMLELAAERTRKPSPGSIVAALQRLERSGWAEIQCSEADSSPKKFYSLSPAGRDQLEAERMNRSSAVARFVEDSGWEHSFREFLNSNN